MRINALIVLLLTGLVAATFGFGIYLFAQLVPDMRDSLGFDISCVGTITAAGQFGFLLCALLAAWITPRVGGGWVIFVSGVVCAAALLLIPLTHDIVLIGMLLTVLAGTAATVFVPMVDVISRTVAFNYRGMAMGLVSSGTSYGVFVNSLLVPLYAAQGQWPMVWWIVGLITVVLAIGVAVVFKRAGLFLQPEAATISEPMPKVDKAALMQPWVLTVWAMNFLLGFSTFPFQNYLSSYLRTELNFAVTYTAQIWASIGFVGMFAGLAVGWLADRVGLRIAMMLVYACVALAAMILVTHPGGYWPMVAGVLFALAFYPIFGLIPAYVSKMAGSAAMAVTLFGVANILQGVGGMLGNFSGAVLARFSGSFVGVYVAIALVAVSLAGLTLRLPKEAGAMQVANPLATVST
ncbi:nitrate/nitrite transporter [Pseudomonas sp. LP_7_YM]|uniref:MFS transporter n=1 Tax=Pseudomonas sp. LP_7_YM TaxID=2485137 RepID=UPI001061919E|nr:MFS transporter [Pseudomonas sp. LP_7_YM]TDV67911.1 putative MFS family arabinose efflux permease [Pseudomonas sp. LP_7_YM]